jgi:hypothetical protein
VPTNRSTYALRAATGGGTLIAAGPPERIANTPGSHTGEYLKPRLEHPSVPLIDLPMAGRKIA